MLKFRGKMRLFKSLDVKHTVIYSRSKCPASGPQTSSDFTHPVSDFSCLGTHPRALCRVIQTGQMPRCFALSNEKNQRRLGLNALQRK